MKEMAKTKTQKNCLNFVAISEWAIFFISSFQQQGIYIHFFCSAYIAGPTQRPIFSLVDVVMHCNVFGFVLHIQDPGANWKLKTRNLKLSDGNEFNSSLNRFLFSLRFVFSPMNFIQNLYIRSRRLLELRFSLCWPGKMKENINIARKMKLNLIFIFCGAVKMTLFNNELKKFQLQKSRFFKQKKKEYMKKSETDEFKRLSWFIWWIYFSQEWIWNKGKL